MLRTRLALAFAATALLAAGLTAGGTALLSARAASDRALDEIERQADVLAATLPASGTTSSAPVVYLLRGRRTRRVGARTALGQAVAAHPPGPGYHRGRLEVDSPPRELLYVQVPTAGAPVLLARAPNAADPSLAPFEEALVVSAAVAMALALALATVMAARLTRPLRALTAAIGRVHAGEAGATVTVSSHDEVGELASTFNEMSLDLARARATQRDFLASASHELKTPITALRAQGEALADSALEPSVAGTHIVRGTERLQRLVGDLLTLAELERPGFAIADELVDLIAVAQATVTRHASQARALGITLQRTGVEPATARGDAGRLEQALSNLVENALRVLPRGGHITVSTAPGELAVSDDGPGLTAEEIPRAFERFFLHERHRSDRSVGSGLGLALVAELVEAMGGRAEVSSPPSEGARFRLALRHA